MQATYSTRSYETPPLVPYDLSFWFETDGVTNPSTFAGSVESVTRLTSTAGVPFYRVTFGRPLGDKDQVWTYNSGVLADIEAGEADAEARLPITLSMPSTPPAQRDEIDVVVRLGGANTNTLGAGRRVCVSITFDQAIPAP